MRVLLVEDDKELATALAGALAKAAHAVDQVADGRQALAAVQAQLYDLVLSTSACRTWTVSRC